MITTLSASKDVWISLVTGPAGVADTRALPILSNLLIQADTDTVRVTGTDLERQISTSSSDVLINGNGNGNVSLVVPAGKLLSIIKLSDPEHVITIMEDRDGTVTINSGKSRYRLQCLDSAAFPGFDLGQTEYSVGMMAHSFAEMLDLASVAMAANDHRYVLNGMMLELVSDGSHSTVRVVASDGHRLSTCEHRNTIIPVEINRQMILPRRSVAELRKLAAASGSEGEIKLTASFNAARVVMPTGIEFYTKLIDGRFPDYNRVIPSESSIKYGLTIDKPALMAALARVSVVMHLEKHRGIKFALDAPNSTLWLTATNGDAEDAVESLSVTECSGGDFTVGFNATYIVDALSKIRTSDVRIAVTDNQSASLLTESGYVSSSCVEQNRHIVMPMRL